MPYWELPFTPIYQLDEEDVPSEYLFLWSIHESLETDKEKRDFRAKYPILSKDWRAEYRLANPQDDANLYFFGYAGKLQSKQAYDMAVGMAKDFGISVDNIGRENYKVYPEFIDEQMEFQAVPTLGYDQERWLQEHKNYYQNYYLPGLDRGGDPREEINFTRITSVMEEKIMDTYLQAPEGDARDVMRCNDQVLDNALVKFKGYTQMFNTAQCTRFRQTTVPGAGQAEAGFYED